MTSQHAAGPSIHDIPFSILSDLFREMREARSAGRKRSSNFLPKNGGNGTKDKLTRVWLRIAELLHVGRDVMQSRGADEAIVPAFLIPPDISFKLISLIVPTLDSVHIYMGMKDKKLAAAFIKALDLTPDSADAQWLSNFTEPPYRPQRWKTSTDVIDGNLPTVVWAVLKGNRRDGTAGRCPLKSSLTVGMVWNALDVISSGASRRSRRIGRATNLAPVSSLPSISARNQSKVSGPTSSLVRSGIEQAFIAPGEEVLSELDERARVLRELIGLGTAEEVADIARIVLKDLHIRFTQDQFFVWFHRHAKQHFNQIHDIHRLLQDCFQPTFEVGDVSVQLGKYASVMLTERPSRKQLNVVCRELRGEGDGMGMSTSVKALSGSSAQIENDDGYFLMEAKLDGERMQLHKMKREDGCGYEVKTFTRKGNCSSSMYAEALHDVVIAGVLAEEVILDGEIMIWDILQETWVRFEDFRDTASRIAERNVPRGSSLMLKFMVFDVLYVNQGKKGTSQPGAQDGSERPKAPNMVVRFPLFKRRALLERIVKTKETPFTPGAKASIEVLSWERGRTEEDLTSALQRYETLGYEGVIAKSPNMPYALAERRMDIAVKLKPDYFDGGLQDIDVLILGGKWSTSKGGRARRTGRLSSFLIGVRAEDLDDAPGWLGRGEEWIAHVTRNTRWTPVGSVGTGYSDNDLEMLLKELDGNWRAFDRDHLPNHFEMRDAQDGCLTDVAKWIEPSKSVVLTIRAYELNRKNFLLRFPRVERINWEKPFFDVPSIHHLMDLDENKKPAFVRPGEGEAEHLSTRGRNFVLDPEEKKEAEAISEARDGGHKVTGGKRNRTVVQTAIGADVSSVTKLSLAFNGLTFHVIGPDVGPKECVEVMVYELGGSFVQNLTSHVDYIVAIVADTPKVKRFQNRFKHIDAAEQVRPIVLSKWVEACHKSGNFVELQMADVVYATPDLRRKLLRHTDCFGDPWEQPASVESLVRCMSTVQQARREDDKDSLFLDEEPDPEIETSLVTAHREAGGLFYGFLVYVPETAVPVSGARYAMELFGASITETLDSKTSHVLLHSSLVQQWSRGALFDDGSSGTRATAITNTWVFACLKAGSLVPIEDAPCR